MPSRTSTRFVRSVAGLAAVGTVVAARAARRRSSAVLGPVAALATPDAPAALTPEPIEPAVAVVTPPDTGQIIAFRTPAAPAAADGPLRARRQHEDAAIAQAIGMGLTDVGEVVDHVIAVTERQRSSPVLRRRVEDALGVQAG
jgi:hypothetical protein